MRPPRPLRVGRIPFANLVPVYRALEEILPPGAVRFVPGQPSALNRRLRAGRLDVSPSSSIEYGRNPGRYLVVPGISVASRKKVMSVLLFSRTPLAALPPGPVGATSASDTSVVLLEILLRASRGGRDRVVRSRLPVDGGMDRFGAFLAIGDEALRARVAHPDWHVTDLGEWWHRETGTPFVFALWIVSRESLAARGEAVRAFGRALLSAKRAARKAIDRSGGAGLPVPDGVPRPLVEEFWRNLSYDLDGEREGLALFFRLARKIGRLPAAPPLRFLDVGAGPAW